MMSNLKTVDGSAQILDPLYQKQKEGVAKMRTSLLACADDPVTSKRAIQNITTMRVYHQIARIIKYLEIMDKLEDKLYESIDASIDNANAQNPSTWMMLLTIQERLQKSMIESHKLLQPYLDIQEFSVVELTAADNTESDSSDNILNADSRDKIRAGAQAALLALGAGESVCNS